MTRKRNRHSRAESLRKQDRFRWDHDDELEMLAWLDFTLIQDDSGKLFKDTIVDRLKKSRDADYTIAQVDRKLNRHWTRLGREDAKDKNEIYSIGTACLK